jgi:ribosomal protein S18 acetylase RimI-like enzyme
MSKSKVVKMWPATMELRVRTVLSEICEHQEWIDYNISIYVNKADAKDAADPDREPMLKIGKARVWRYMGKYGYNTMDSFDLTQDMYDLWSAIISKDARKAFDFYDELDYDLLYVDSIKIDPAYKNQGLGTLALKKIEEYLGSQCGLMTVIPDHGKNLERLKKWYKRLGYKEAGDTNVFYKSLRDWSDE